MAKAKPGVKYSMIGVKQKDGSIKRVAMEASKARALRAKRAKEKSLAETRSLIPTGYRDSVDPASIDAAVRGAIESRVAPLTQQQKDAQSVANANVEALAGLGRQTQASLDTLLTNAQQRTQGFMQTAGQAAAAQDATNSRAAEQMGAMLGTALNPQVAKLVDQQNAPGAAQQFAGNTQNLWGLSLGSQAQQDFFQRAQGIAQMQNAEDTTAQRKQLSRVITAIGAQIAAERQRKAELVRQFAGEEAQFGLDKSTAERAFGQQQFENELAAFDAETGRLSALKPSGRGGGSGGGSGNGTWSGNKRWQTVGDAVYDNVRKMAAQVNQPKDPKLPGGAKYTAEEVWGKGNGVWREAFNQMTARGIPKSAAALMATRMFTGSIQRSTAPKIKKMLDNRGVPLQTQANIIRNAFGDQAWQAVSTRPTANNRPAGAGTHAPPSNSVSNPGGNVSLWMEKLKGKTIAAGGKKWQLIGGRSGKWTFRQIGPDHTIVRVVKARPDWSPIISLRESF